MYTLSAKRGVKLSSFELIAGSYAQHRAIGDEDFRLSADFIFSWDGETFVKEEVVGSEASRMLRQARIDGKVAGGWRWTDSLWELEMSGTTLSGRGWGAGTPLTWHVTWSQHLGARLTRGTLDWHILKQNKLKMSTLRRCTSAPNPQLLKSPLWEVASPL